MQITPERLRELTANNSSFSKEVPGLQIAWDSTSLGLLKTCPRKYFYTMILGHGAVNDHLTFGILYHECQEQYKLRLHDTGDHEEATRHAVLHALSASGRHIPQEDGSLKWEAWESDIPEKNRFTLVHTIIY